MENQLLNKPSIFVGEVKALKDILRVWCPNHETHPEYMQIETEFFDFMNQQLAPEQIIDAVNKYFVNDIEMFIPITLLKITKRRGAPTGKGLYIYGRARYYFPIPKTLDDLITFLLSCGIDISWKEE